MLSRSNTWFRGAQTEQKAPAPAVAKALPYPVEDHKDVVIPTIAHDPAPPRHNDLDIRDATADYYHLTQTSELLTERLQAWKHAVGYLEDYISATEKVHKAHAKEYEKVLKVYIMGMIQTYTNH